MTEENKASTMAKSILDYIYEEGEGKISYSETFGILELVKLQIAKDMEE